MSFALSFFICLMAATIQSSKTVSFGPEEYYPSERYALLQIRDSLNSTLDLHSNWTGPPCYDNNTTWVGILCSNWHVVHIVLEGVELTGSLPSLQSITFLSRLSFRNNSLFGPLPDLTNLVYLQSVLLSKNSFSGSIPVELIFLPNLSQLELQENSLTGTIPPFNQSTLTVFNVSNDRLEGQIPETPVLLSFPTSSYDNNLDLCGKPLGKQCPVVPIVPGNAPPSPAQGPSKPKSGKDKALRVWSIVLIALAAVLVPFTVMLFFLCYHRRTQGKGAREEEHSETSVDRTEKKAHSSVSIGDPMRTAEMEFFDKDNPTFDLEDLLRASAELLGKGRLGSTYKAMLESGAVVAVKRLKEMNGLTKKEFVQQMQLLGKMRHENLMEIVSFYFSKDEKLVVHGYVSGGSLFELLHDNRGAGRVPLTWATRLSIVKGIARGLAYLHQSLPSHKVPHANLKSSNVLIVNQNQTYHPKLTDFGFLPLIPARKLTETLAVGKAPEVSQGKKLTHKADVYCFGLIMLEVITGRIPGQFSPGNDNVTDDLSEWVRSVVHRDWSTDILDLEILSAKEGHQEMLQLTEIALECTSTMPESRPKMSEVLRRIEEIKEESSRAETHGEIQADDVQNA